MKILLVCEDKDVRSKMLFSLESSFLATVVEAEMPDEGLERFREKEDQGFDLILWNVKDAKTTEIQRFFAGTAACPSILVVEGDGKDLKPKPGWNIFGTIKRTLLLTELPQLITVFMQKNGIEPTGETARDFCRIRTSLLLSVAPLQGDLYIRLGDNKFVKLFREGDRFDLQDMEKYTVKKGVEYLFVRQNQAQEFLDKYRIELEKVSMAKPLSLDEAARSAASAHETIQELGNQLGFNKDVQSLVKHQLQISMKAMGRSPRLGDLMARLESFKGRYIGAHSTLTGYMACAIASQAEWGSEATFHKLNMAAFMHDITLTNHALAECETLAEAERGDFTPEEKRAYKNHAIKAAEVVQTLKECPPDVDQIILAHHERPDGTGFPRGLTSSYISPLAAIFIVAHDLAKESLRMMGQFSPRDYLAAVSLKYPGSQFRKVLSAVEKL